MTRTSATLRAKINTTTNTNRANTRRMRLSEVRFSNRFTSELSEQEMFLRVDPVQVAAPRLIGWSDRLAAEFNLQRPNASISCNSNTGTGAEGIADLAVLAGNWWPPSAKPYAARYGGHQFGQWAGQLGDGRAITLGELTDREGRTWEFQLKGAGRTPYSRRGDGLAVLRSSLREFVASEAMHALRVPTTRSLSLVETGEQVMRDMFYDGHPEYERGAIASRQSPTFIRFGNFEIHAAHGETEALKRLLHYTITNFFPHIDVHSPEATAIFFREVCERTARMIVEWLRVGFVHGVMNTDNMSILGLTIDYGPFGWLDSYEPDWTPNITDLPGRRYCFGRQASIALWNCERLAEALQTVIGDPSAIDEGLRAFVTEYERRFLAMMAAKLGINKLSGEADIKLIAELDQMLQSTPTDMTIFFRSLARQGSIRENMSEAFYETPSSQSEALISRWIEAYETRLARDQVVEDVRRQSMNQNNPWIVPRNYILFKTIEEVAKGDLNSLDRLTQALANPYQENALYQEYTLKRPDWAKTQPGSSTLSCSS